METGTNQTNGLKDGAIAVVNGRMSLYLKRTPGDYLAQKGGFGVHDRDLERAKKNGCVSVVIQYNGINKDCLYWCDLKTYTQSGDFFRFHDGMYRFVPIHELNVLDGEPGELP